MPVLDLRDITAQHDRYRASHVIRTVITWPDDEEARKRYMATLMATHLADLKKDSEQLPDPMKIEGFPETIKAIQLWEDLKSTEALFIRWFEENGGFESVVNADSFHCYMNDVSKSHKDHCSAGLVLCLIRRMATHHADLSGGASVNKAVYIIEHERMFDTIAHKNTNDIRRAWSTYKPVAHLCAALFDILCDTVCEYKGADLIAAVMNMKLVDELPDFLMRAAAYQKFGLSYTPPRSKQTLLDPDKIWRLPEEKQWPEDDYPAQPFDEAFLSLARSYKAPIPAS